MIEVRAAVRATGGWWLILVFASWAAAAAPLGAGRQRLEAVLADLSTLSADFEQQVFDETGAPLETSRGTLNLMRPGRFSWVYAEPYRQTITSDGTTLWLYDEDLAQVTVNTVAGNVAGSAAQLLGEEVDLDAQYEITELGDRDGATWVRLLPRDGQNPQYTAVEVGLGPETLAAMRLTDNLGQTTELRFSHVIRNPKLDPARFRFEPPAGVDVVTGAGATVAPQ